MISNKEISARKAVFNWIGVYPFFISHARSGGQWINAVMEFYFNRPRLRRSVCFSGRDDWLWCHDHDIDLMVFNKLGGSGCIFLTRSPDSTIASYYIYKKVLDGYSYDQIFSSGINDDYIMDLFNGYIQLYDRYLKGADCVVSYENFISDDKRIDEFTKIVNFFNEQDVISFSRSTDVDMVVKSFNKMSKDFLFSNINDMSLNPVMLSDPYIKFRTKFISYIGDELLGMFRDYIGVHYQSIVDSTA